MNYLKQYTFFTILILTILDIPSFAQQKNVLFLIVDDLNDFTGFYGGHPDVKTPHLDRFARNSVVFTNAHASVTACNPSRASMMTGLFPHNINTLTNEDGFFRDKPENKDLITLPQYFKLNGYESVGVGKIYHRQRGGLDIPFRESDTLSWTRQRIGGTGAWGAGAAPEVVLPNGIKIQPLAIGEEDTQDWKSADFTANYLQQEQDQPFFLACGIVKPHLPWYAPQKYFDLYDTIDVALPPISKTDLQDIPNIYSTGDHLLFDSIQWKQGVKGYLSAISFADSCIGHILTALDNSPHKDQTIVVITSDHGWHLGEKLRWKKFTLWEESTRVPMMIYDPTTEVKGICDKAVSLLDLYPTLVDLCSLPEKEGLDGRLLTPYLLNPSVDIPGYALTSKTFPQLIHSLRTDNWRFTDYKNTNANIKAELYDHTTDSNEWYNVASLCPPKVEEMRAVVTTILNGNKQPFDDALREENQITCITPCTNIDFSEEVDCINLNAAPGFDISGIDFGPCQDSMGVALVDGNCTIIRGCGDFIQEGTNYMPAFFSSIETCQQIIEEANICHTRSLVITDSLFIKPTYRVSHRIKVNTTIESESEVALSAGLFIKLVSGTHIKTGAIFNARIADCATPILQIPDLIQPRIKNNHIETKLEKLKLTIYPNPAYQTMPINFYLPAVKQATLIIYDLNGQQVKTWKLNSLLAGWQQVHFPGGNIAPGLYFISLQSGQSKATQKFTIIQ